MVRKKYFLVTPTGTLGLLLHPSPSFAQRAYPKLTYSNRLPKGGHFAAGEQRELFSEELRAASRSLR
jgi:hypothetical protein